MTHSRRPLGKTGLEVSVLGFGGGPLGDPSLGEADAAALVGRALELGCNLFDTAPSYGESERRLGRLLAEAGTGVDVLVSTKLGYGVPGVPDWTGACIRQGIDQARERLGRDHLDLAHLHSCPRHVLEDGEVVAALVEAVDLGKVRVAAYSGEGEALDWAIGSGAFGSVQFSLNPWDQANLPRLARCRELGLGVLTKRTLGNAVWVLPEGPPPEAPDLAEYQERFLGLDLDPVAEDWAGTCLRFAASHPGVSSCLMGTRRPERLEQATQALALGALPGDWSALLEQRWRARGMGWPGLI